MIHQTTLSDFARRYVESRILCRGYAKTLLKRAAAFEQHAGERDITGLLTEPNLAAFLKSIKGSPWTVNKYRQDILAIWRAAADEELASYPNVRKVRRLPQRSLVIDCYTEDEARALAKFAETLRGGLPNGVSRRDYWPAAIRAGWDSGLRRGDIWAIRRDSIRPDGSLLSVQSKTGGLVVCRLRKSTIQAIERAGGGLAWPLEEWSFGMHFREIVQGSGVNRGTFKWLRRASGSYVEALQPGAGYKHLGHADPGVFAKHYDARLGAATLPVPPEL